MGLWTYFRDKVGYNEEVARSRRALTRILDLSYKVGHNCPDDVQVKLAIRLIGFDAVNHPKPDLPRLREAFSTIASCAGRICDRRGIEDEDYCATLIVATCIQWEQGDKFLPKQRR